MTKEDDADAIRLAAHEWFVRLTDLNADAQKRAELQAWLNADPRHEDAFERAKALNAAAGQLTRGDIDHDLLPRRAASIPTFQAKLELGAPTRRAVHIISAMAALVAIAFVALPYLDRPTNAPVAVQVESYTFISEVGEHRDILLSDNTHVTLGPASEVSVQFLPDARRVDLLRGAAFFDVKSDPNRPFKVTSHMTTATALGTRFDVRQSSGLTRVAVAEGRVAVMHPLVVSGERTSLSSQEILEPSQQVSATGATGLADVAPVNVDLVGEWRNDRLIYNGARIGELVSDAKRYTTKPILIAEGSEHILDFRISGAFDGRDIEEMLSSLAIVHPVTVDLSGPDEILLAANGP